MKIHEYFEQYSASDCKLLALFVAEKIHNNLSINDKLIFPLMYGSWREGVPFEGDIVYNSNLSPADICILYSLIVYREAKNSILHELWMSYKNLRYFTIDEIEAYIQGISQRIPLDEKAIYLLERLNQVKEFLIYCNDKLEYPILEPIKEGFRLNLWNKDIGYQIKGNLDEIVKQFTDPIKRLCLERK